MSFDVGATDCFNSGFSAPVLDSRNEAHLPTFRRPSQAHTRLSRSHAHPWWARGDSCTACQGTHSPGCLTQIAAAPVSAPRRYRCGRRVAGAQAGAHGVSGFVQARKPDGLRAARFDRAEENGADGGSAQSRASSGTRSLPSGAAAFVGLGLRRASHSTPGRPSFATGGFTSPVEAGNRCLKSCSG